MTAANRLDEAQSEEAAPESVMFYEQKNPLLFRIQTSGDVIHDNDLCCGPGGNMETSGQPGTVLELTRMANHLSSG